MGYVLRPGVTFCLIANRAIFLDIPANRYFCFDARAEDDAFGKLVQGREIDLADANSLRPHFASGLIVPVEGEQLPVACVIPAAVESIPDQNGRPKLQDLTLLATYLFMARRMVRHGHLEKLLEGLHTVRLAQRNRRNRISHQGLANCEASLLAVDRILRAHEQCLPRAAALYRYLSIKGHSPSLVVGVRLRPFGAHAWVQVDGFLVGDFPEIVRTYQPIVLV